MRGALVLDHGEMTWPAPPLPPPAAPPQAKKDEKKEKEGPKDLYEPTLKNALTATGTVGGILGLGAISPGARSVAAFHRVKVTVTKHFVQVLVGRDGVGNQKVVDVSFC